MTISRRTGAVVALGLAQTLAWASSYYLLAILAVSIGRDLGVDTSTVFAAFSVALLVSAALGPLSGRTIDRWGGRLVLMGSNIVFAIGLAALGLAQGAIGLFVSWLILGVGMGSGLYEAAFASLVRLYGRDSRVAITGVTLLAGFASTVGWPLSTLLESHLGWRGACFAWAGLHVCIGVPLNWSLPKAAAAGTPDPNGTPAAETAWTVAMTRSAVLLGLVFAITWFVSTSMAAHLPSLLVAAGATAAAALAAGALIGPAQVGGRLLEFGVLRHVHPLLSARIACLLHPVGAVTLISFGAPMAAMFAILHGAGNGILTIAMGILPLAIFGPIGYGKRQGLLMAPGRVVQASAPWVFGLCLDRWGANTLWLSASLGITAFLALLPLPSVAATTKGSAVDVAPVR
jgi:predicted MFS family arabinose efflux permease